MDRLRPLPSVVVLPLTLLLAVVCRELTSPVPPSVVVHSPSPPAVASPRFRVGVLRVGVGCLGCWVRVVWFGWGGSGKNAKNQHTKKL